MFAFTSMGGNIDKVINKGEGPHVFRVNAIIKELQKMLDECNPLLKIFRRARDLLETHKGIDVSIRIIGGYYYTSENMHLKNINLNSTQYKDLESFSNWILSIGNGTTNSPLNIDDDSDSVIVEIPKELLIQITNNKIQALVDSTYPKFRNRFQQPEYLKERAILATINEVVDEINNYMIDLIPDDKREYLSADNISKCSNTCNDANILYPIEYLNTLNANNYPPNKFVLKVGVPIMLLRNLNQSLRLCNGTRLIITNLGDNVLEAIIITETHVGQQTYIPRINLTTRGSHWPFTLNRRQYPVKVCYSMTINNSQGQTLSNVGVYLKKQVFTHGQLAICCGLTCNS
ncbi:hypothetical protein BS78_03G166600 [Paspalum vaginatum]|nr:hypothetical protein BS78_03G166600 [Paspalum vaginatum]